MTKKAEQLFDAFTFALGGASIASSHVAMPIVASDRIAKAWDERLAGAKCKGSAPPNRGRFTKLSAECT